MQVVPGDEVKPGNYKSGILSVEGRRGRLTSEKQRADLGTKNTLARRYFYPGCHQLEPYRSEMQDHPPVLPVTERLTESVLTLPTGTAVGRQEIELMGRITRLGMEHAAEVRRRLEARAIPLPASEKVYTGTPLVAGSSRPVSWTRSSRSTRIGWSS